MQGGVTFTDRLIEKIRAKRSILNVGLDPQLRFMPPHLIDWALAHYDRTFEGMGQLFFRFNQEIIDVIRPFAVSVKPQIAFYEAYGYWGIWALEKTIQHAQSQGLLVITDAKRGDGGDTAKAYADGHLGKVPFFDGAIESPLRADALTVHAWIGRSCIDPFVAAVKEHGTGVFVVDKTSFAPNSEVEQTITQSGLPNWQVLARMVEEWGRGTEGKYGYRDLGVVMGATYPEDAQVMRAILPVAWFLIPGYGEQGGGSDGAVVGINKDGLGGIVNSSRAIIAAYLKGQFQTVSVDFARAAAKAAQAARDDLNAALKRAGKLPW